MNIGIIHIINITYIIHIVNLVNIVTTACCLLSAQGAHIPPPAVSQPPAAVVCGYRTRMHACAQYRMYALQSN